MKFKIASILELIIPLSVALMLTAFLGCGGGASAYGAPQRYDGAWTARFWSDSLLTVGASSPTGTVVCNDAGQPSIPLTMAHGYGKTLWTSTCDGAVSYSDPTGAGTTVFDWEITIDIDADGQVLASVNGLYAGPGSCQDLYTCSASIGGAPFSMMRPAY